VQGACVALDEPARQYEPALHSPAPVGVEDPSGQYEPATQMSAAGAVEPAEQ
jgi:hypothetical protein